MTDGFGRRARRLVPPRARRHHRAQDFARDTGVVVQPADATQGRRRHRARLHRPRRPHQPHQGAAEIRARRAWASRSSSRWSRRSSAAKLDARAGRGAWRRGRRSTARAHIGVHAQKQAGLQLDRRRAAGRQAHRRADARARRDRARSRRRRHPPHGLAEPADLRRADEQGRRGGSRDRGARALDQRELDPRRPRRLHRQRRLQVRRLRHQAPRRGDRALVRGARRARRAGQHPSDRLPSFLRAALHRRHRPARLQGAGRPRTAMPSRATTSWSAAASGRTRRWRARSIATSRPTDAPAHHRAHAQGLSGASRLARTKASWPSRAATTIEALKPMTDAEAAHELRTAAADRRRCCRRARRSRRSSAPGSTASSPA